MRLLLASIVLAFLTVACAKPPKDTPVEWRQLAPAGKTLTLVDQSTVQILRFENDSVVAATIGEGGAGGAVAAPLWYWQIRGKVLVISEIPLPDDVQGSSGVPPSEEGVVELLAEPVLQGKTVSVMRSSGKRVVYKLTETGSI